MQTLIRCSGKKLFLFSKPCTLAFKMKCQCLRFSSILWWESILQTKYLYIYHASWCLHHQFNLSNSEAAVTPNPTLLQKPAGLCLPRKWLLDALTTVTAVSQAVLTENEWEMMRFCRSVRFGVNAIALQSVGWITLMLILISRCFAPPALFCFISKGNRIFGDRRSHLTWSNILLIGAVMDTAAQLFFCCIINHTHTHKLLVIHTDLCILFDIQSHL